MYFISVMQLLESLFYKINYFEQFMYEPAKMIHKRLNKWIISILFVVVYENVSVLKQDSYKVISQ